MKDFLKYTLATFTGLFLFTLLIGFMGIVAIASVVFMQSRSVEAKPSSILYLPLEGSIEERNEDNPLNYLLGTSEQVLSQEAILNAINKAKTNENICGIYIRSGQFEANGPAMLQELRDALEDFKRTGKFIVAYGDMYTQGGYYVSSVADKVIINPEGTLTWMGMASQPIFYKDLLDKVGIKMQVFKAGNYKSAVEPFIATEMSEANREQVSSFINCIWDNIVAGVASSRQIPADSLYRYADKCLAFAPSTETVSTGMIDDIMYWDEVRNLLKEYSKIGEKEELRLLSVSDVNSNESLLNKSAQEIAVYYAYGDISDSPSSSIDRGIYSQKICKDLQKLAEDKNVRAVVLRINSGGGSAYASEQIWRSIELLKKEKPVVVSMSGMAASGGYYIACAANKICAEPTTLTGSIGVFGLFPDVSTLFEDKLGLHFDVVKTNELSDMGNRSRPFNRAEQGILQAYVDRTYSLFKKRVAEGRNIDIEKIEALAQGRVWTGKQAHELQLVDTLGGLNLAITEAASLAQIENYELATYPQQTSWYETLLQNSQENYIESKLRETFGPYTIHLGMLKQLDKKNCIQARIPYYLNLTN